MRYSIEIYRGHQTKTGEQPLERVNDEISINESVETFMGKNRLLPHSERLRILVSWGQHQKHGIYDSDNDHDTPPSPHSTTTALTDSSQQNILDLRNEVDVVVSDFGLLRLRRITASILDHLHTNSFLWDHLDWMHYYPEDLDLVKHDSVEVKIPGWFGIGRRRVKVQFHI